MNRFEKYFKLLIFGLIIIGVVIVWGFSRKVIVNTPIEVIETEISSDTGEKIFFNESEYTGLAKVSVLSNEKDVDTKVEELLGSDYDSYSGVLSNIVGNYDLYISLIKSDVEDVVGDMPVIFSSYLGNEKLDVRGILKSYPVFTIKDSLIVVGFCGSTGVIYAYNYPDNPGKELVVCEYEDVKFSTDSKKLFEIGDIHSIAIQSNKSYVRDIEGFTVLFTRG